MNPLPDLRVLLSNSLAVAQSLDSVGAVLVRNEDPHVREIGASIAGAGSAVRGLAQVTGALHARAVELEANLTEIEANLTELQRRFQ